MRSFVVEDPDGPDLEFVGELLVDENLHDVGFVKIYKTASGRFVMNQKLSTRPGHISVHRALVCETSQEVAQELGHSQGAKLVANRLGLTTKQRI